MWFDEVYYRITILRTHYTHNIIISKHDDNINDKIMIFLDNQVYCNIDMCIYTINACIYTLLHLTE